MNCVKESTLLKGYGAPGASEQVALTCPPRQPDNLAFTGRDVVLIGGIGLALVILAVILWRR